MLKAFHQKTIGMVLFWNSYKRYCNVIIHELLIAWSVEILILEKVQVTGGYNSFRESQTLSILLRIHLTDHYSYSCPYGKPYRPTSAQVINRKFNSTLSGVNRTWVSSLQK